MEARLEKAVKTKETEIPLLNQKFVEDLLPYGLNLNIFSIWPCASSKEDKYSTFPMPKY